jgi:hypothetical protein
MLDAFVLLAATDEARAEHRDALTILNEWAAGDTTLIRRRRRLPDQIRRGPLKRQRLRCPE